MRRKKTCYECKAALSKDEIGLSQKLLNVDSEGYYCIPCMAQYLGCMEDDLKAKVEEFKEQGCTLFLR